MRAQLARDDLADEDRFHFEFSLGKALEDAGEYAESFEHYREGNRLRREMIRYDADENHAHVERSKRLFTREFFAERAGWGCPAPDPIFIVGLPRSGSTLIEQILASHSQVEGTHGAAGRRACSRAWSAARTTRADGSAYPRALDEVLRRGAARARASGISRRPASSARRRAPFFIDKMPNNFAHVGPHPPDAAEREDHRRAPPSARLLLLGLQAALRARPELHATTSPRSAATTATTSS